MRNAIIFGVTGQDGSYLSEMLVQKDYNVIGIKRRSSTNNLHRLDEAGVLDNSKFRLVEGDVSDYSSVSGILKNYVGDYAEIYNTAAQSHVATSFEQPLYTFNVNALGVNNILEVIRRDGYKDNVRMLQCSTSEMFGDSYCVSAHNKYQDETTRFNPKSPYAVSKVAAHQLVNLYREAYGLFCCAAITFNHESQRRGENFVTRKITKYVAQLAHCMHHHLSLPKLKLGNIKTHRDWGHARDYCRAFHQILQLSQPEDFVISTQVTHSVEEFLEAAFGYIGVQWQDWVEIDEELLRPAEVPYLLGKSEKIRKKIGWCPEYTFSDLVKEMVDYDYKLLENK